MRLFLCIPLCSLIVLFSYPASVSTVFEDAKYWETLGRAEIEAKLKSKPNEGIAKNVVLFVGDGMGLTSIVAGRIYKGQLESKTGEEGYLSFEKFPNAGLLKTYSVDRQVPDSASTATALFSGVKANFHTLGLDAKSVNNVCKSDEGQAKVSSMMDWAIEAGKSTGIVTTTRVTHATPAAAYAHTSNRDWECDSSIPTNQRGLGCKDIARQLVEDEPGKNINVIFAGGEQVLRAGMNATASVCTRKDGADLVSVWMKNQSGKNRKWSFAKNKQQMMGIHNSTDYVLGLFAPDHMPYDKERDQSSTGQPSLEEMVIKAIQLLSKNPKGYVLIVEGGRIDHAHHENRAQIALEEVVAFDLAIQAAIEMTKSEETLLVVTADHSHSFAMAGYPKRGNPISGLADVTPDGFSYQTLSYINGPGYTYHRLKNLTRLVSVNGTFDTSNKNTWRNLTTASGISPRPNRTEPHFAGFWMDSETHSGTDVPVYASGPFSHLFSGVHEQTHVAYGIAYSACIGPYQKKCDRIEANKVSNGHQNNPTTFKIFFTTFAFQVLVVQLLNF